MEVVVTGRQMAVTPALRRYAEDRARKVERLASGAAKVALILKVEKHRHHAEVSANVNGFLLQATEETEEMYASIDRAMTKIVKQLRKYKEKLSRRRGRASSDWSGESE
jgi:putative sigma-54 modulation protein